MVPSPTSTDRERLRRSLREAGFDVFHGPFSPGVYNDLLDAEGLVESGLLSKLPEELPSSSSTTTTTASAAGDRRRRTEAFLIGNTKHLWPYFLRWLREEIDRNRRGPAPQPNETNDDGDDDDGDPIIPFEDPLDTYERTAIAAIVARICGGGPRDLYWSSDLDPSRMVSMARIASCTGFSYLDKDTHLSVHPVFGTWHSYRAVLVLEAPSTTEPPPPPPAVVLANPMSPEDARKAKRAFDAALAVSTERPSVDDDGDDTAEPRSAGVVIVGEDERRRLDEMLGRGRYDEEEEGGGPGIGHTGLSVRVADAWIALRDAVSIGRDEYRFGDDQLRYHYTKDAGCLARGIRGLAP